MSLFKIGIEGQTGVEVYVDELLAPGTPTGRIDVVFTLFETTKKKDLEIVKTFPTMRCYHSSINEC